MGNRFRDKEVEEGLKQTQTAVPPAEAAEGEDSGRQSAQPEEPHRRGSKAVRGVGKVLGGDILADRMVLKQIPLLLLCMFYLLLLVGNRYRIESMSIDKQATEERINYLREQRIQMQKQYQQSVKISQIAEDLKERGIGITAGPPYEIDMKEKTTSTSRR